jgi:hypothetical protein
MTHLAAPRAATVHGQFFTINLVLSKFCRRNSWAYPDCAVTKPIFCSPVANLLEMASGALHYSVMGWDAARALAPGQADCHLPDEEAAASVFQADGAGATARAGDE